jgi:uncharacterized protein YjiS (DUF1127 family)
MTVSQVTASPRSFPIIAGSQWRSYGAQIGTKIGAWPKRLAAGALRLVVTAIRESQIRRAIREMQRLDDRLLHDIGFSRSALEHAVRHGRERDLTRVRARFLWPSF